MEKTDTQQEKSKRDAFVARLKERYPDKSFDDDEAIYSQINDDYDDYDNRINGYLDNEKKLTDLFSSDPKSAAFLMSWSKGSDPVVEMVRRFGTEIAEAVNDPERQEAIAEANKDYLERIAKNNQLEKEYNANIETSIAEIEKLKAEKGYTDEEVDAGMQKLCQIAYDAIVGKFTPEALEFAFKGIRHDSDVEAAAYEAEVRGRNAAIEEKIKKRGRGDGIPTGSNGRNPDRSNKPRRNLGALERASEASSIWDKKI